MIVDQEYCVLEYWCDYPRKDRCTIDKLDLTDYEKQLIRDGESICKHDKHSNYYYKPIKYDSIME